MLLAGAAKVVPPDPARLRARQAARAVAAGALTLGLVKLLGTVAGGGLGDQMLGFVVSLFLTAFVRDMTPARQRVTILLALFPGFGAGVLAAVLRPVPWLAGAGLVAVLTCTAYFAARGPRAMALGIVSLLAYVVSLLGRATIGELPVRLVVVVIAVAVALAVHETLWSERPPAVVARIERAMRRRIASMLAHLQAALDEGGWPVGARRWLAEAMPRLDEASLLVETLLGAPGVTREAVFRVIELDIVATDLARRLLDRLPQAGEERKATQEELQRLRQAIEGSARPSGAGPRQSGLVAAIADLASGFEPVALQGPSTAGRDAASEGAEARPSFGPAASQAAPADVASWLDPAARRAIQVALATSAAIVVGQVIPTRWYWAGIVAFVVIVGTRSRGESLIKARQYLAGTFGGVVAGVLLATALAGHPDASFAVSLVALFLAFQAWTAAYGLMIFWITVALGLAFGLLGYFAPGVLLARLVETVLGALCGIAATVFVLPIKTADVVLTAKRLYWRALGAVVEAAVPGLLGGDGDTAIVPLMATLDTRLQDLRAALRPQWHPPLQGPRVRSERPLRVLLGCHYSARALGRLAAEPGAPVPAEPARSIKSEALRTAMSIRELCAEPVGSLAPPTADPAPAPSGHPRAELALVLLMRLDAGLGRAAQLL